MTLEPEDDAARANWGGKWRMPTKAEFDWLINNCTCTWTTQNEVDGMLVTAENGNSIFFPVAGVYDGESLSNVRSSSSYWSSSCPPDIAAYFLDFNKKGIARIAGLHRKYGLPVRPVCD